MNFVGSTFAAIAIVGVIALAAQTSTGRIDVTANVDPTPLSGSDGQTYLAYELVATTLTGISAAHLERVDVFDERESTPLIRYSGAELDERVMRPEADPAVRYGRVIRGGTTALIHIWVKLAKERPLPKTLRHSFAFLAEDGVEVAAGDARVNIQSAAPLVVGSPFRSGLWLAHNGPGNHRAAHWGSALVSEGRARIPQRFAIDFIGLDATGSAVRGDFRKSANDDWIGFGREVLAVVDGVVYDARDGVAENQPLVELPRAASPSVADTYGNYVIIAMDDHTFVHYAHLQRNSVVVKTGQAVRRGQVVGRLGNSGNTNAAHLHFNVTDRASPEDAQGLPFVFDTFELLGNTTAGLALGAEPSSHKPELSPVRRAKALPLDGTVVRFP